MRRGGAPTSIALLMTPRTPVLPALLLALALPAATSAKAPAPAPVPPQVQADLAARADLFATLVRASLPPATGTRSAVPAKLRKALPAMADAARRAARRPLHAHGPANKTTKKPAKAHAAVSVLRRLETDQVIERTGDMT